jgi:phage tail sheath gpL-like
MVENYPANYQLFLLILKYCYAKLPQIKIKITTYKNKYINGNCPILFKIENVRTLDE